jgi:hypothetical protein
MVKELAEERHSSGMGWIAPDASFRMLSRARKG